MRTLEFKLSLTSQYAALYALEMRSSLSNFFSSTFFVSEIQGHVLVHFMNFRFLELFTGCCVKIVLL